MAAAAATLPSLMDHGMPPSGGRDRSVTIHIEQASSAEQIAAVRELFLEYQAAVGVDLSFQGFAEEIASLPGCYAPPGGRLLLARDASRYAGCVALRPIDAARCEMKRLYVRPGLAGRGLGRTLVAAILGEAKAIGYEVMVLDTLPQMTAAQHLYESLGFRDTAPYRFNPVAGARFLALELRRG
jgi:ribosomal protein S18 acetylase RimI-like enzyme